MKLVLLLVVIAACSKASSAPVPAPIPDMGALSELQESLATRCPLALTCSRTLLEDFERRERSGWADDVLPLGTTARALCCVDERTRANVLISYFQGAGYTPTVVSVSLAGPSRFAPLLRATAEVVEPFLSSAERNRLEAVASHQDSSAVQDAPNAIVGRFEVRSVYTGPDAAERALVIERRYDHGQTRDSRCRQTRETPEQCRARVDRDLRATRR